ncbi:hypothetical protein [Pseudomonas sp. PSE14]|uniref:hypothetical protein n=1 Tax=Pseudomonas sp. PSE14 TaxID=3016341 RepID=UPI0023D83797|nr:hypothetical protein [Pseudomonas sp. PSE14]WEJ71047.1 hypothetical protein O6P39_20610 [Pseudomonas sp. PSE14]
MKVLKLSAVLAAAALLSACGGSNQAKVCGSDDVKNQLVKIFLSGSLSSQADALTKAELKDVAIIEKDPDSGVLECVGTLSVPVVGQVASGTLKYRIAPAAKSDHDYLLLLADGDLANAFAKRIEGMIPRQ